MHLKSHYVLNWNSLCISPTFSDHDGEEDSDSKTYQLVNNGCMKWRIYDINYNISGKIDERKTILLHFNYPSLFYHLLYIFLHNKHQTWLLFMILWSLLFPTIQRSDYRLTTTLCPFWVILVVHWTSETLIQSSSSKVLLNGSRVAISRLVCYFNFWCGFECFTLYIIHLCILLCCFQWVEWRDPLNVCKDVLESIFFFVFSKSMNICRFILTEKKYLLLFFYLISIFQLFRLALKMHEASDRRILELKSKYYSLSLKGKSILYFGPLRTFRNSWRWRYIGVFT